MEEARQQSSFVTVVAWIFIVLSGFSSAIAILQNLMLQTMFRGREFDQSLQHPPPGMPPMAVFMFSHFQLVFFAFLLASVVTLVCSIGLLKRWNWARLCFIALMGLGIAWQLAGAVLQFATLSSMQQHVEAAAAHGGPDMRLVLVSISIVSVLFLVGVAVLFGWIAKRLLSPDIAAEFRGATGAGGT